LVSVDFHVYLESASVSEGPTAGIAGDSLLDERVEFLVRGQALGIVGRLLSSSSESNTVAVETTSRW